MKRFYTLIILLITITSSSCFASPITNGYVFHFIIHTDNTETYMVCYNSITHEYSYNSVEPGSYISNSQNDESGFFFVEAKNHKIPLYVEFDFLNSNPYNNQEPFTVYLQDLNTSKKIIDNTTIGDMGLILAYTDDELIYYSTEYTIIRDSESERQIYIPLIYNDVCHHYFSSELQLWIYDGVSYTSEHYNTATSQFGIDGAPKIVITNGSVISNVITPPNGCGNTGIYDIYLTSDKKRLYLLAYDSEILANILYMYDMSKNEWIHVVDMPDSFCYGDIYITNDEQWMISKSHAIDFGDFDVYENDTIYLTSLESGESINLLDEFACIYPEFTNIIVDSKGEFGVICIK